MARTEARLTPFEDEPAQAAPATSTPAEDARTIADKQINPLSDLWSLVFQYDATVVDVGGPVGESLVHSLKFQPVLPVDLTDDIRLITRPVFQLASAETPSGGSGIVDRETSLGDTTMATLLGPASKVASGWFWGVGASWGFPTAGEESLGSDQFTVGPAATVWHFGPEWVLGWFGQSFFSYADTDSDRSSTNIINQQIFALWNVPDSLWKIGMTPNIVYDTKEDDLSLPIGMGATSMVKLGNINVRLLAEVQYYLVDDFADEEWNYRILVAPIIRKPERFRAPIF